jgi:predicted alpha/beta superfamily hydrolase
MKRFVVFIAFLILFGTLAKAGEVKKEETIEIGEKVTLKSKILNEDRKILVYLPAGYNRTPRRYPVLYALDGNTYFMASLGILKYHTDYSSAPEMIIVAIPNVDRGRDFTPTQTDYSSSTGGADKFLDFIRDELFPFIEGNYRTQPFRIFSGHSLGGLCVFYALLTRPEMFDSYIAISSSIWWGDKMLVKQARDFFNGTDIFDKSLYFSIEGGDSDHIKSNQEMSQLLENCQRQDFRWKFEHMKDEGHVSLWIRSFYEGLSFVSSWNVPERVENMGVNAVLIYFADKKIDISEDLLEHLGFGYWRQDKYPEAIKIYSLYIEKYPDAADAYHTLGDICRDSGDIARAVKTWKKGLIIAREKNQTALINVLLQHIADAEKKEEKKSLHP